MQSFCSEVVTLQKLRKDGESLMIICTCFFSRVQKYSLRYLEVLFVKSSTKDSKTKKFGKICKAQAIRMDNIQLWEMKERWNLFLKKKLLDFRGIVKFWTQRFFSFRFYTWNWFNFKYCPKISHTMLKVAK